MRARSVSFWTFAGTCPGSVQAGRHLLRNGVHVRAQLAERHAAVLRHHPRAVQVPQALVRVRLRACAAFRDFLWVVRDSVSCETTGGR